MIEYKIGNDLKLRLAFVLNGQRVNPDTVPFDIKVWTLYPSQARIASYDGENWVNCLMRDDYLEVNLNAPQFNAGRLNCDITLHYPDADMPDLVMDKVCKVRFDNPLINPTTNDVVITGEISDAIVGLSAYNIAIQNGFVGSVIEWLQSLKQPAIYAATIAENMMGDFSEDETLRSTAEQGRVTAETSRTNAETSRGTAEQGRVTAEITRVNSETARGTAETARTNAETSRGAAEQGRVTAETARTNAETSRGTAEQGRVTAETSRTNAETSRDTAEQERVNSETSRTNAETARENAEATRQSQEGTRQSQEGTRQTQEQARQATIAGLTAQFEAKIDKTSITQDLGDSETDIMSQKATTEAIMKAHDNEINFFAYGVSRDLTGTGQTLTRVGNLSLHKTRPILSKVRGCVKNAQGVQYYLDNNTDFLKADGVTPSVLDGTDGDVMTEIPEMYVYEYTEGNYEYTYLSEFPLPNFKRIPKTYHGRYEGSYDTTTNQLRSVINSNIRGGLPATGQSVFYYNSGAIKDRNLDWSPDRLLSHYVRELLFRVHYGTYDSQATFNSALTAEGYLQGGLGAGVTTLDDRWEWNGYNPFVPCGYTAELGNRTGVKNFTMPYAYDAQNTTTHINWYKGIHNVATIYNIGEYVADIEDTSIGLGNGKLYKCIQQTTAGILLTDTAYFTLQTRTVVQTNRFIGIEQPFGHTFKQTIDAIIELTDNYTTTKCYVYDNPAHFTSTKTANARFLCNMPSAEGYIKLFNQYTVVPYSIGGSSGAWGYDQFLWAGVLGGDLRGLLVGGHTVFESFSGLGCVDSSRSPSTASTYIGVRLCNFPEGSNIE